MNGAAASTTNISIWPFMMLFLLLIQAVMAQMLAVADELTAPQVVLCFAPALLVPHTYT